MRSHDEGEHRFSHWAKELLERILLEPCWATAQDHSGVSIGNDPQKQMNWRAKQTWYGVKPSQLDWRLIQLGPCIYAEIELKYGSGRPTDGQETTMRLLRERGIPTGCAWNLRQFYDLVLAAGFRVHANAANILTEIEARFAAAEDGAALKQPTKKRSYKPATNRPTMAQIQRAESLRARYR